MLDPHAALVETLLLGCRILDAQGVVDSSGHLSARLPGLDAFVVPARQAPGLATRDSLMVIDLDGTVLEGDGTPPLEWPIHARILRTRPDVGAVLHSHSPMSRAFSISSTPLAPVFGVAAPWFHEPLPVCRIADVVRTPEAGDRVAETLGAGPALLLHAHGSVVVGASPDEVTVRAVTVEQIAQSLLRAHQLGGVEAPSPVELDHWRDVPSGHRKAWDYLVATTPGRGL